MLESKNNHLDPQASLLYGAEMSENKVERLTNTQLAAEARARGLVPLRMGIDPIWKHQASGRIMALTPAHTGDAPGYNRAIKNALSDLRKNFPTEEELAKANRTPEEIEQAQAGAAAATRSKKQQAVKAAKIKREQEAQALFKKLHAPFKNLAEVQKAYAASESWDGTVEEFAEWLRDLSPANREQVHRSVFPERYGR